jgi:selenocysteine lyase/cysteine desulfurase
MGVNNILAREHQINEHIFKKLSGIKNLHILASEHTDRLGIFSFYIDDVHYNLITKILNDQFGIQTRGGCSCAGTYGHYLLNVNQETSIAIKEKILEGCLIERPGWVRMSIHPTMTNLEIEYVCIAIKRIAENFKLWEGDYKYDAIKNEFIYIGDTPSKKEIIENWFNL